jgi:choline kinase
MVPEGESPLLLPANKHKQLVVIDFEYANANLPGLEFANHFVSRSILHISLSFVTCCHLLAGR